MSLYNVTLSTSAYKSLSSSPLTNNNSLMATSTDNDLVVVTNGTVNFTTVTITASSTYFNGTTMTLNNTSVTTSTVRTDPTIVFNSTSSISMTGTNFVSIAILFWSLL